MPSKKGTQFLGTKILVVEDYMLNQELIEAMLNGMGVEVDIAEDGSEALEKLEKYDYDLILMDVMMPDMDGYETTQKIREMEKGKNIPIIAVLIARYCYQYLAMLPRILPNVLSLGVSKM